jgi:hypothetical protein
MIRSKPKRGGLEKVSKTDKKEIEFAAADYYGNSKERNRFVCGGPSTCPYVRSLVRTLRTTIRSVGGKPTDGRYVEIVPVCINDAHGGVNIVGKEPAREKEAHRYYCRLI